MPALLVLNTRVLDSFILIRVSNTISPKRWDKIVSHTHTAVSSVFLYTKNT